MIRSKIIISLIAVDLSRQKKLDADPKAIQQIEFVRQKKKKLDANDNTTDAGDNDQSIKETRLQVLDLWILG